MSKQQWAARKGANFLSQLEKQYIYIIIYIAPLSLSTNKTIEKFARINNYRDRISPYARTLADNITHTLTDHITFIRVQSK